MCRRQMQLRRNSADAGGGGGSGGGAEGDRARGRGAGRGASLHLAHWMTQLPESEECEPPEQDLQTWSVEELRKRSKELNLIDVAGIAVDGNAKNQSPHDKNENEKSPSKSSSDSQITVRTSPVVVDTIPVCRQCHKKCFSKPNSPLVSQREKQPSPKESAEKVSPKKTNSTWSLANTSCGNCQKSPNFSKLERKGAMKLLNPKDAPQAALKVIDSIEQNQKRLKSTSYNFGNDSPLLGSRSSSSEVRSINSKALLERRDFAGSIRSPSPCASSRNVSPLSTSRTTCSSLAYSSSGTDLRAASPAAIQCVIAQEKYLNEVKCVENVVLSKTKNCHSPRRQEKMTRQKAENVLNRVLGMNIITKRENVGGCLRSSSVFLDDESIHEADRDCRRSPSRSALRRTTDLARVNGDIKKGLREDLNANMRCSEVASGEDLEWGPLMLMGLTAINPAAHLMRVEPSALRRPGALVAGAAASSAASVPPNIALVPPTPDFSGGPINHDLSIDESPDSPQPEEPPYVTLKRYGTLSSLERMPSDETDDGNQRSNHEPDTTKIFATQSSYGAGAGGLMGWTARAGSFVVEKMNIFNYTESVQISAAAASVQAALPNHKQPSFLERYLGVGGGAGAGAEEAGAADAGEGSAASGEEAWGTPSSGDLSDNAFPDSDHGTLSSPTKSSSSYAGDDDTELMMDELLLAPTIAGPTLRPLLPRRRLEPLLEEEDSGSEEQPVAPPPAASHSQGSAEPARAHGRPADGGCAAPRHIAYACASEGGSAVDGRRGGAARAGGGAGAAPELSERSPDTTPTNEAPSSTSRAASRESLEARWGVAAGVAAAFGAGGGGGGAGAGAARRGSASSASTPSTLERTAIHNPSPPPHSSNDNQTESEPEVEAIPSEPERLSPRTEMRLALDQGKDMLADQEEQWSQRRGGECDPWSWRAACQRSLLRRVASADAVTLCRPPPRPGRAPHPPLTSVHTHRTAPDTTSRSSVYAWKGIAENDKSAELTEMQRLAQVEAQTMRSRTRSQCQNGKILGFLRRRASSDSPRRTELASLTAQTQRPFSPRRTTVSNNGYYKICFVNGSV